MKLIKDIYFVNYKNIIFKLKYILLYFNKCEFKILTVIEEINFQTDSEFKKI